MFASGTQRRYQASVGRPVNILQLQQKAVTDDPFKGDKIPHNSKDQSGFIVMKNNYLA